MLSTSLCFPAGQLTLHQKFSTTVLVADERWSLSLQNRVYGLHITLDRYNVLWTPQLLILLPFFTNLKRLFVWYHSLKYLKLHNFLLHISQYPKLTLIIFYVFYFSHHNVFIFKSVLNLFFFSLNKNMKSLVIGLLFLCIKIF